MRLRSYLRGLGAGIFVSAVLMGIATSSAKDKMTDEQVKQRAAQLGMVEEGSVLIKPGTEEADTKADQSASDEKQENPKPDTGQDTEVKQEPDNKQEETGKEESQKEDIKPSNNTQADKAENETKEDKEDKEVKEDNSKETKEENDSAPANEDLAMGGSSGGDNAETDDPETGNPDSKESYTLQIAAGSSSYTVAMLLMKGGVIDDADDFDKYLCDHGYDHRINHGVFKIPAGSDYDQIARMITGNK